MSEINVNILVANVLNGMTCVLNDDQLNKLKDQLYIQLHDVEITNKKYELSESINENDIMKINYFEASMKISKYSDGTIKQYIRTAKLLRNFVGKNFADIKAADVKYFLAWNQKEHNWSTTTLQNNIHNLQAFYRFLYKEDLISENPMLKIDRIQSEKVVKTGFTSSELEKIRLACKDNARDAALIEFMYASGVRVNELSQLKWSDIDIRNKSLVVEGKGKKQREVLFSERAGFYMLRYFDERRESEHRTRDEMYNRPLFAGIKKKPGSNDYEALTNDGIRRILKRIGEKAGITDIHPHKFRRSFATDAINRGMPLEQLKELMGHNQYDTTLVYAKVKSSRVEQSYRMYCE